ncbi:MAG: ABC transporter substrate-binding protein [Bacteroidota bacterium]
MNPLSLALDWTPNINHIGFFVAQEKGFYKNLGLDVKLIDPSDDNYQLTPAKKVELGLADFALCPTESVISYRTKAKPIELIAVAALLQEDLSAIVVKNDSSIQSPKDLDGKSYASYQARYEDEIVRQMIKNAGGKGNIEVNYPQKLGIWNTVLEGNFDATWIFMNWEGVEAESKEVDLTYFKMKDYNVPYSYSPVIATTAANIKTKRKAYVDFLTATKEGYLYSANHPEASAHLLKKSVPTHDQNIDLNKALAITKHHFGNREDWGKMKEEVISEFLHWIYERKLEVQKVGVAEIMTNELIK